jgi:inner membrane protein
MDNVTHSLAGVLVAEMVCLGREQEPDAPAFRTAALWTSVLANNLPDMDFVYRRLTPGKLGYLLHHRGHTHTVVGALVLSALSLGLVVAGARVRSVRFNPTSLRWLAALATAGTLLHVLMDYQNNYGVHPFWPIYDGWFYGDSLFIVEPLLWCVAVPAIALSCRTRVASGLVVALFLGVLAFGARSRAVPHSELWGLFLLALVISVICALSPRPRRIPIGVAGWLTVTAGFVAAGWAAAAETTRSLAAHFPGTRGVELVRTPAPGNPLCWSIIALGLEGDRYVARRGTVSIAPSWLPPRRCLSLDGRTTTAPMTPLGAADPGVVWRSEFSAPVRELAALDADHCDAAAFLRYSRAPFWKPGTPYVVGDLRFDRSPALEFAEMALSATGRCPPNVPPWTPPRTDLISGGPAERARRSSIDAKGTAPFQ